MQRHCLLGALLLVVTAGGCTTTSPNAQPGVSAQASPEPVPTPSVTSPATPPVVKDPASEPAQQSLAKSQNALGLALWSQLRADGTDMALSPLSLSTALSMTYLGARGDTRAQMKKVLAITQSDDELGRAYASVLAAWQASDPKRLELRVVNRLFADRTLTMEAPFVATTKDSFGAPVERLDFIGAPDSSRKTINDWVAGQTKDRIVELLPPGSIIPDTRLVLTNAVYLQASWAHPFQKHATRPAAFHLPDGKTTKVETMRQLSQLRHAVVDGVSLLELPFSDGRWAMTIALPEKRDGLARLEDALTVERLDTWAAALKGTYVDVSLPKFRLEMTDALALKKPLMALGMTDAFTPGRADFEGIAVPGTQADNLIIRDVFHKSFVDVNEAGTEAAAASAVVMQRERGTTVAGDPVVFRADHGFMFFIRDRKTGALAFMGRVTEPRS